MAGYNEISIELPQILDRDIRSTVFTHRSLGLARERSANEDTRQPHYNLKLAHVGDAVLGDVVSQLLAERHPELTLGQTAGQMVSNATLTQICHAYGLFDELRASPDIQNIKDCDTKHHADLFEAYVGGLATCQRQMKHSELENIGNGPIPVEKWLCALFSIVAEHFVGDVTGTQDEQQRRESSIEWLCSAPSTLPRTPHNRAIAAVNEVFRRQQQQSPRYFVETVQRPQRWKAQCRAIINGQKFRFEAMGPTHKAAKRAAAALVCRRLGIIM